ncbi:uncharacterized protein LOC127804058 isoform X2 [Diospyros lotus]|uniref:uncharacterized protein LOC127804058 isoform X2 n=1 Tax=Diospyros lotus TaxID=55363 RepID=UPI002255936F|nr:uncharacterized protein LOC127804058 isoform X2 [Diospyros lotus]
MARTMAFCISIPTASSRSLLRLPYLNPQFCVNCFPSSSSTPSSISNGNNNILRLAPCRAAKQQQSQRGPVKKGNNKKKKKVGGGDDSYNTDDVEIEDDGFGADATQPKYQPLPLPNPPAGFVLDKQGRVLMVSNKRVATIVSDEEVESILPTAAYALAKIHMHLVHSGFCYTARGGFCYTEDDIFEFRTDDGQDVDGLPTEGIEITCFHLDGSHYMIYTPSDPLLFVAVKDQNGQLQIVDDDLLEDPAVIGAIDEETEFNALVEEEAALLDSLLGKR